MDTNDIETLIAETLNAAIDGDEAPEEVQAIRLIRTFDAEGLLTTDAGLVLQMADGSEYQITIVQSR